MIEYKLDFFKFNKFTDTAIADREIIQQLQCFGDNLLTPSPILQICNTEKKSTVTTVSHHYDFKGIHFPDENTQHHGLFVEAEHLGQPAVHF